MHATLTFVPRQRDLFGESAQRPALTTPEVDAAIEAHAPCFIGVSGGCDSQALAYRTIEHLDTAGHRGPRYLIHADLGRVEWRDSLPVCERTAERLGIDLVVVRRRAGGLMERWLSRWEANCERYRKLECVRLIMPFSSAALRFCTSELKHAVISSEIRRRFPSGVVLSAIGLRRDESPARARRPVAAIDEKLCRRSGSGYAWHPILAWNKDDVRRYIAERGDVLHEAYTRYGSTRVSCTFCILASAGDLRAAATCDDNAAIYRELVDLEIRSTFSFQSGKWLGDVAPALLDSGTRERLLEAKERARRREAAEATIPPHLLYQKGWPVAVPTAQEASLLAGVRREVAAAVGLDIDYPTPDQIIGRYVTRMAERDLKVGVPAA